MTVAGARIAVLGAGANGASIGADLIAAGHDVTLVEQWPAHVAAMRTTGLTIRMAERELAVQPRVIHLCQVAELRHPFDVVLVVMKAYDTAWAARLLAPHLAADGVMAAVQNGMTTDAVAAAVGAERTVGTVIEVSSTMDVPGEVRRHTAPEASWFAVDADPRADRVADLLAVSGRVERFADIQSAKWMKLVSNSSLLVTTALLGLPMLDARSVPGVEEVMIAAGDEALAVGRARGHDAARRRLRLRPRRRDHHGPAGLAEGPAQRGRGSQRPRGRRGRAPGHPDARQRADRGAGPARRARRAAAGSGPRPAAGRPDVTGPVPGSLSTRR